MMITAKIENYVAGYRGFLLENEKEVAKTSLFGTEKAARNALNRKIQDFNLMHEADMPLLIEGQTLIVYEKSEPDAQAVENAQDVAEEVKDVAENTTSGQESEATAPQGSTQKMEMSVLAQQAIEGELLNQPPQITGFIQRGESVTIYFADGKTRKTTAERLLNINKPSNADTKLKRVKQIVEA